MDDNTLARSPAVADDNDDSDGLKNNDFNDVGVVFDVNSGVVTFEAGVTLSLSDCGLSMLIACCVSESSSASVSTSFRLGFWIWQFWKLMAIILSSFEVIFVESK